MSRLQVMGSLVILLGSFLGVGCKGDDFDQRFERYEALSHECGQKAEDEFREARRLLDAFGAEHGQDSNFVTEYLRLEGRLKQPINDAFERCLEEAKNAELE